jgi:hypothetical protein
MNATLRGLMDDRTTELARKHETFINEPTEEHAWQLAAAAENLLDVLNEM